MKSATRYWLLGSVLAASAALGVALADPAPASPATPPAHPAMGAHEWPTSDAAEPTDEEWSAAPELRAVKGEMLRVRDVSGGKFECSERAIRDWMRVTCTPDHSTEQFFGVVWGLGGDMSSAKASIAPASTLEQYKGPPRDFQGPITRVMGAYATLTFRIKRGSASLFDIDVIHWVENYDGGPSIAMRPGLLVDVSWALGEPSPTVTYQ